MPPDRLRIDGALGGNVPPAAERQGAARFSFREPRGVRPSPGREIGGKACGVSRIVPRRGRTVLGADWIQDG